MVFAGRDSGTCPGHWDLGSPPTEIGFGNRGWNSKHPPHWTEAKNDDVVSGLILQTSNHYDPSAHTTFCQRKSF